MLDVDCVPAPGWLAAAVAALRAHREAAVVSGLTAYPDEGFTYRVLGVLLRAFVDPGGAGPTRFMTGNNAVLRRDVLLAHPVPPLDPRHLANRLQTESIRAAGGRLYFEPAMRVTHRFGGWPTERRSAGGWGTARSGSVEVGGMMVAIYEARASRAGRPESAVPR